MSRRDTIIIAVLINAGLLIILFISALKSNNATEEIVSNVSPSVAETSELTMHSKESVGGDEVDQVLHQYSQSTNAKETLSAKATFPAIAGTAATHIIVPAAQESPIVDSIFAEAQNIPAPSIQSFTEDKSGSSMTSSFTASSEKVESANLEVVVKKGDVLEKIARLHLVSVDEIMKLNHLSTTRLKIGQILKVPNKNSKKTHIVKESASTTAAPATSSVSFSPKYYTVKNGDNPWTIAVKNHMKVDELLKLNNLDEEKARRLKPGDRLRIK